MKNLLTIGALIAVSIFTMSCSSKTTNAEAVTENTSSQESINTSDTTKSNVTKSNATKSIILDVRTQGEWYNDGHAPCAKLIPLDQLEQRLEELRPYNDITVVCRSGGRAGKAVQILKSAGFERVSNAGAWSNANCE